MCNTYARSGREKYGIHNKNVSIYDRGYMMFEFENIDKEQKKKKEK